MRFEKVTYQKTYNLGNYCSEKVGADMVLNDGDDPQEAMDALKAFVEEWHHENNKGLHLEVDYPSFPMSPTIIPPFQTIVSTDNLNGNAETFLTEEQKALMEIEHISEKVLLDGFWLLGKKYPNVQTAIDNKKAQLTK